MGWQTSNTVSSTFLAAGQSSPWYHRWICPLLTHMQIRRIHTQILQNAELKKWKYFHITCEKRQASVHHLSVLVFCITKHKVQKRVRKSFFFFAGSSKLKTKYDLDIVWNYYLCKTQLLKVLQRDVTRDFWQSERAIESAALLPCVRTSHECPKQDLCALSRLSFTSCLPVWKASAPAGK